MADEKKTESFRTKMTVLGQTEIGGFKRGDSNVTIYEVEAQNEAGDKIDKKLRTFHEELPIGVLEEYEVQPYWHQDYGQTYTIKLLTKGRASKKDVNELRRQVTNLAGRVAKLEEWFEEMRQEQQKGRTLDEVVGDGPVKAPWDQ
jgi:hypothetical protein